MNVLRVKQVIGVVLLTAFIISASWKVYDSFGHRRDGEVIIFFIIIILLMIFLLARRIFRY